MFVKNNDDFISEEELKLHPENETNVIKDNIEQKTPHNIEHIEDKESKQESQLKKAVSFKKLKAPSKVKNKKDKSKKSESKPKSQIGRKSKYFTHVKPRLEQIAAWCRNEGALDKDIVKRLGVGMSNYMRYKLDYSELREALKSKDEVDNMVENALLKRALGFKEKVRKPMKIRVDQYTESVVYVDEETYYPPDTTAQIYWTKNRRRDKWANSDRLELAASSATQSETNEVLTSMSEQVKNLLIAKQVKEDIAPLNEEIGDGK